jgi:hypothetical protein
MPPRVIRAPLLSSSRSLSRPTTRRPRMPRCTRSSARCTHPLLALRTGRSLPSCVRTSSAARMSLGCSCMSTVPSVRRVCADSRVQCTPPHSRSLTMISTVAIFTIPLPSVQAPAPVPSWPTTRSRESGTLPTVCRSRFSARRRLGCSDRALLGPGPLACALRDQHRPECAPRTLAYSSRHATLALPPPRELAPLDSYH